MVDFPASHVWLPEGMYMLWTPIFGCCSFVYIVYANPQLASGLHLLLRDVSWICNTLGIGLDSIPPVSLVSICIQVVCTFVTFGTDAVTIQTLFIAGHDFGIFWAAAQPRHQRKMPPFFDFPLQISVCFGDFHGFPKELRISPAFEASWKRPCRRRRQVGCTWRLPTSTYIYYIYIHAVYTYVSYMYSETCWMSWIYIYILIHMMPVPGPVAPPPPQWYGPLLPDLESFISMVFTAFWMQNLIFPWYLHQFGWKTSYFHRMYNILDAKPTYIGTKEYSYITSLYIYTYIHMYIYTYVHCGLGVQQR